MQSKSPNKFIVKCMEQVMFILNPCYKVLIFLALRYIRVPLYEQGTDKKNAIIHILWFIRSYQIEHINYFQSCTIIFRANKAVIQKLFLKYIQANKFDFQYPITVCRTCYYGHYLKSLQWRLSESAFYQILLCHLTW